MRYLYSLLAILFAFNTILFAQSDPELEEVVVVGYGSQTKKTLTGAVGTVSSESLT